MGLPGSRLSSVIVSATRSETMRVFAQEARCSVRERTIFGNAFILRAKARSAGERGLTSAFGQYESISS